MTSTPEHFGIIAKLKMLKPHNVFHTFSKPDQIILNECCPQIRIPEQSEIINKLKTVEITRGFSYFFQITLNELYLHFRILERFQIIDTMTNADLSLDQCKKHIFFKVAHDQPAGQLARSL